MVTLETFLMMSVHLLRNSEQTQDFIEMKVYMEVKNRRVCSWQDTTTVCHTEIRLNCWVCGTMIFYFTTPFILLKEAVTNTCWELIFPFFKSFFMDKRNTHLLVNVKFTVFFFPLWSSAQYLFIFFTSYTSPIDFISGTGII